jgi:uncharacterized protein with HEPN domain
MNRDRVYLAHILERIARIQDYTAGGYEAFVEQEMIQDAVLRNLAVIGEAVKRLSPELRSQHPHIPWRSIAGMRDVLIHDYMGVDVEEVWNVVQFQLHTLEKEIRLMVAE